MAKQFQAVRGMNDLLPDKTSYWQYAESISRQVLGRYSYREIRFPLIESTDLFKRGIGDVTDVVEKEMYTFPDRNGDSLTLRPEGTAGCVRAALEHGLLHNQVQRLWYYGPMYRHERPQKGRYREFYQLGVEAYGMADSAIDAEIILLAGRLLSELGLADQVSLQINTLGSAQARLNYREQLINYFSKRKEALDEDSQRRLQSNPLRILDSKNPDMRAVIDEAPKMMDCLDDASKRHFDLLCQYLEAANQKFTINTTLVRGLDYYCLTVFEWVTDALGAQGTVCAGGRYDGLVELLGGKPTPAVGFACGLDRLILLMESVKKCQQEPDVFMILDADNTKRGLVLAEQLRVALPSLKIETNFGAASFKSQFKRAYKSGARWAIILENDKMTHSAVTVKDLQNDSEQEQVSIDKLVEWFQVSAALS